VISKSGADSPVGPIATARTLTGGNAHEVYRPKTSAALIPPKPNELLRT